MGLQHLKIWAHTKPEYQRLESWCSINNQDLENALNAVESGDSIRQASAKYEYQNARFVTEFQGVLIS